ncbi:MAG: glutamyl-tRNA reductase [Nitrososphaerota archaeon]|nr:glutamyl-tRNA reductase [Nitrososphaerota archaeon]
MQEDDFAQGILNLRVTHKRASLSALEAFSFVDRDEAAREIKGIPAVEESFVVQTCNRVEVYAVVAGREPEAVLGTVSDFWVRRNGIVDGDLAGLIERSSGTAALLHLLRVAAGLESMVVGEDQILGQIREAYSDEKEAGTVGPVLDRTLRYALQVGKSVRSSTAIDRGAVSVGSVAVELLGKSIQGLRDKKILIIGAGETGEIVGKALALRRAGLVFVANRTYSRAVEMAQALGATAIHFESLENFLVSSDAVAVATSAPHFILTLPMMSRVMARREGRRLAVLDVSEPRNADRAIARLPGLTLLDLDDLQEMSRARIEMRSREIREADKIVQKSLGNLALALKRARAEPLVSALFQKAERVRRTEVSKALARMRSEVDKGGRGGDAVRDRIVEDLSKSLTEALLYDQISNLRRSGANGETATLLAAEKILGVPPTALAGDTEESSAARAGRKDALGRGRPRR